LGYYSGIPEKDNYLNIYDYKAAGFNIRACSGYECLCVCPVGMPPTAGFIGKFYIFRSVQAGYIWLVIIGD
jgi:NADH-quinone oxidoreductase subunit N